jgi:hypothetical protein
VKKNGCGCAKIILRTKYIQPILTCRKLALKGFEDFKGFEGRKLAHVWFHQKILRAMTEIITRKAECL